MYYRLVLELSVETVSKKLQLDFCKKDREQRATDDGQMKMFARDESVDVTRLPYSLSGS